jgi:hypothetical protein
MSIQLSAVANTDFVAQVKQAYQNKGLLKPHVRVRNNVVGDTCKFRYMGKGLANQKGTSDMVTAMNISHSQPTATLSNWNAPEFTDIFDQAEVNFDEKQELAECVAGAIGRRCDQIIIDALDASTPDASDIDLGAANLTMAGIINAKANLVGQGVGNGGLCGVIESGGLKGLLNDEKATSSDYMAVQALIRGDVNTLVGFNMVVLEDRTEGGLTEAASKPDAWFFDKQGIGLAVGIDMKVEVSYQELYTSWLTNGIFKAGAVVIDTAGQQKVQYTKTA